MLTMLTRSWWIFALRGVVAILFGVAALAWPHITLEVLVLLFGAFTLAEGIFAFATAVTDGVGKYGVWVMLEGITEIVAGIATLVWPSITTFMLVYLIAAWAIITGILQIVAAVELRKGIESAGWSILSGILSVIVGVVLALQPTAGALALVWLIGFYAIVFGVLVLVLAFRLRDARNLIRHSIEGD
jgi:uncharacterized membrane protein HdeD (DUF308 family)